MAFYDEVGGAPVFARLVHRFYEGVQADPVLRPLYPDDEWDEAEERLFLFLSQYWGGPKTYGETRGHPRLRMRHQPFVIGPAERDAWIARMTASLDELGLPPEQDGPLRGYLVDAAFAMQNAE